MNDDLMNSEAKLRELTNAETVPRRVYRYLRERMDSGEFVSGQKLPSSRILASRFGVARISVITAFEELDKDGLVDIVPKVGAFFKGIPKVDETSEQVADDSVSAFVAEMMPEMAVVLKDAAAFHLQENRPFALDFYDSELLKKKSFEGIVGRFTKNPRFSVSYAPSAGCIELRRLLAERLRRQRGMLVDAEQVIITSGIQQNLNLTLQVLFDAQDLCLIENPCFPLQRKAFEAAGISLRPLTGGLIGDNWETPEGGSLKAFYLHPGSPMLVVQAQSRAYREHLLEKARDLNCWIIENDVGYEYRRQTLPSYYSLAETSEDVRRVIYFGSFNHTKYPAVNLGYLVCPHELVDAFAGAKRLADHDVDISHQLILAEEIQKGLWDEHLRKVERVLGKRCCVACNFLNERFQKWGSVVSHASGPYIVFKFKVDVDDGLISEFLRKDFGIETFPLSSCYVGEAISTNGLILGVSGYPLTKLMQALKTLEMGMSAYAR